MDRIGTIPVVHTALPGMPWLLAFTTLIGHDFGAGDGATRAPQRHELDAALAPLNTTWLTLEHGTTVQQVPPATTPVPGDAAIVTRAGFAAALTTADCLPITLACSYPTPTTALIHAGWRGLAAGVIEQTLAAFPGLQPQQIHAHIGPCILQDDYEVGPEVRNALLGSPNVTEQHFKPSTATPGHYLANLPAMAVAKLTAAGVPAAHITTHPTSTKNDPLLHSVRRDGAKAGRMASVVAILPGHPG
jgi:YfiH family protein